MEKITTDISTFENLRKGCYTYVDKTDLQIRGEESVWEAAVLALRLAVFMVVGLAAAATCFGNVWDVTVGDFARATAETGDSARIQRAIAAAGEGGVVWFPRGEYEIDTMLVVSNRASLLLHKSARLKAVKAMPFVLRYFGGQFEKGARTDRNLFIRGGEFDGNGLSGCVNVMGCKHFSLADATFGNGKRVGLQLGDPELPRKVADGYEIFGNNLYFICNMPGLAGNVAFLTYLGDSHFTDMVAVDYTVGIRNASGGANRYTRCHVWGGPVRKPGTNESEYLPNSIAFDLGGGETLLDACYADTAMIGYLVRRSARIVNCAYYNNYPVFKMDGPEVFVHEDGSELLVTGGRFAKDSPHATLYRRGEKAGRLVWSDNRALRFTAEELKGLEDALKAGDRTLGERDRGFR